jgi:cytochrome c556
MRSLLYFGAVLAGFAVTSTAVGQSASPAAIIKARQAQFREIGTAFKAINDELKKGTPGKFVMTSSARQIAGNLKQTGTMFPAGSGPSSGVKTKALAAIWAKPTEFSRLNAAAVAEANKLVVVLRGSDAAAISVQVKALGRTCQSCHKPFRLDE